MARMGGGGTRRGRPFVRRHFHASLWVPPSPGFRDDSGTVWGRFGDGSGTARGQFVAPPVMVFPLGGARPLQAAGAQAPPPPLHISYNWDSFAWPGHSSPAAQHWHWVDFCGAYGAVFFTFAAPAAPQSIMFALPPVRHALQAQRWRRRRRPMFWAADRELGTFEAPVGKRWRPCRRQIPGRTSALSSARRETSNGNCSRAARHMTRPVAMGKRTVFCCMFGV
eukprot:gene12342-biopygen21471